MAELPINVAGGGTGGTTVETASNNLNFLPFQEFQILTSNNGEVLIDEFGNIISKPLF